MKNKYKYLKGNKIFCKSYYMTICNAEGRCIFSGKDVTYRSAENLSLRNGNSSELDNGVNIEFMEAIGAIGFGPAGVKTQTNEIISGNNEVFDKKSFLFNC